MILDSKTIRGKYPQGVYYQKERSKYVAGCKVNGKRKYIGSFDNANEASNAYIKFKYKLIIDITSDINDVRVKNGLIRHAEKLIRGFI